MKAIWNGQIIAEADKSDMIMIENDWYFPPKTLRWEFFTDSERIKKDNWQGETYFYNVDVEGAYNPDCAWYIPEPPQDAVERVETNFANYVAFWRGVEIKE